MFPNFAELHHQLSEVGRSAGETASSYAERVIARLDRIVDAVTNEEFDEDRRFLTLSVAAGTTEIASNLPAGDKWEIEAVTSDVATTVVLLLDNQVRWRGTFANAETKFGNGVILIGAGQFSVMSSADAIITVQAKARRKRPTPVAKAAGNIVERPKGPDPRQDASEEGRHGNPAVTSVNGSR